MAKRAIVDQITDPNQLQLHHAELDRRVKELDRRAFLTPSEQRERASLKKQKLILKDRIHASHTPSDADG
jgi:uncharacterized protein YdcH (DUF465 family)